MFRVFYKQEYFFKIGNNISPDFQNMITFSIRKNMNQEPMMILSVELTRDSKIHLYQPLLCTYKLLILHQCNY